MSVLDDPQEFLKFSLLATHFAIGFNGGDFMNRWNGEAFVQLPLNPSEQQMYANLFPREDFLTEAKRAENFLDASGKRSLGWHFSSYIKRDAKYVSLS